MILAQNESAAVKASDGAGLKCQDQQKIEWLAQLVVAKAYVDQLSRSQALPADRIAALRKAIQNAESSHMSRSMLAKLLHMEPSLEKSAAMAKSPADSARLHALAEILNRPST